MVEFYEVLKDKRVKTAILLFLVLFIAVYNLSKTDDLRYVEEKAKSITSDIQLQKELIKTNKAYYQDNSGQTYLIGPDPYLYYRIARNLVELGTINDSVNSQQVFKNEEYLFENFPADRLRLAPIGTVMQKELMPYFVYYFHEIWNIFNKAELSRTAFFLPVFLGLVSIAVVFFISFIATKSKSCAFFSSFLLAMNPTFIAFNFGGYTDTHVLAMTFSLLTFLFFVLVFKANNTFTKLIAGILTIASIYLLKFSWRGWFFVLVLMGAYVFFNIIKLFFSKKINIKKAAITAIGILFLAFILYQNDAINSTIDRLIVPQRINQFHPSSLGTVDELKPLSLNSLSNYFGGWLILIFIMFSAANIFRKQNRTEPFNWFVLLWFLFFIIVGKFSMRFIFFATPPFAILLGLLCKDFAEYFKKEKTRLIASLALVFLFSIILYPTIFEVWQNGPMMNKAIEETGLFLQQTEKNSVLNVWWDSGYYWQTFARRGTTMDGGLFETQMPFYFANAAITNDSELSRQINLMTGCGIAPIPDKQIFESMTIEEGLKNISSETNFSKCKNDVYLIIDERNLLMTPTFYPYSQRAKKEKSELPVSILEKESFSLGGFKAKDLPYISPIINCANINNYVVKCENHVIDTQKITFQGNPLNSLIVIKNSERNEKYFNPESTNVSLVVFQEDKNNFRAVLIDKKIKDSIIVKLFAGEKIEGFEQIHQTHLPIRIVTLKVLSIK